MEILVVDDDIVDRENIKRLLSKFGEECYLKEANSVNQALSFCQQQDFDVILLDYRMPQRDGVELVIELSQRRREQSNVIVMMSNSDDEKLAIECIQAGAQDFLIKKDVNPLRLRRSIIQAQKRFELEKELRASFRKVKNLAERDQLTSLANRYLFEESLKVALANKNRASGELVLVLFDLDNFKFVNDSYGHSVGDKLLVGLANRIRNCLRGNELFARLGGDEFVIVFTKLERVEHVVNIINRIHKSLEEPFEIENRNIRTSMSVGVSVYSADENLSSDDLLKRADIAMYRAKQEGKGRTCFFEASLQGLIEKRFEIESNLSAAVENDELFLEFQPIFNTSDMSLYGCEVLVRWNKNDKVLMPHEFIPISEESNQIHEIGFWVIANTLKQIAEWQQKVNFDKVVSINLSAIQLYDSELTSKIITLCKNYGVSYDLLEFELTETALIEKIHERADFFTGLHKLGVSIALDDFGTGFSSISHLLNFPIKTVKIDKTVVHGLFLKGKEKRLLSGLSKMIQTIGLESVAEGIENQEAEEKCKLLGVNRLQGNLFSHPLSAEEFYNKYLNQSSQ